MRQTDNRDVTLLISDRFVWQIARNCISGKIQKQKKKIIVEKKIQYQDNILNERVKR